MENLKLTKEQKHQQCLKEIKATLIAAAICCIWHIGTAFLLNGNKSAHFLGMPAWFSVSVFGTIILSIASVIILTKKVFKDYEYDEESEDMAK
ncbi:MAG: YhdT family protein [Treponema sp.]|nr:YhdT family protein [Treponema sp.]